MKIANLVAGAAVTTLLAAGAATPASAAAGFIALEGSDATTLHHDTVYTPQLFKYLQGGSSKSVLVLDAGGGDAPSPIGAATDTVVTSLSGVTLSDYSALYVESTSGCCTADPTLLDGYGAAVNAFVAAGGNVSIENYVGGAYDGVVPGGAGSLGNVLGAGIPGSGSACSDGELVTADGIAKGFGQPPVDGCWSHQSFNLKYWSGFGYQDLIHADPAYGFADGSSFMATGGSLGSTTPEPATWALMLIGVGGIGFAMRSGRKATATA